MIFCPKKSKSTRTKTDTSGSSYGTLQAKRNSVTFHHFQRISKYKQRYYFLCTGSLTSSYAKDCDVAVIMYDVTSQQSFDATTRWANEVKKEAQKYREREVLLVLAGNKTDLEDERVVSTQEGEVRAKEVGATFFEVSATSFESVRRMFDYIQGYLVPSKDKVPITARAGAAGKTFQPEDFEIDISRDPDDINSVPPARAVMPSQAIFDENYDGNDELGGYGKKKKKKKGGLSCCPC